MSKEKQTDETIEKLRKLKEDKQEKKEIKPHRKPKKDTDKEKINELTETLQRLQAEFENYKKRIDKEKQQFVKYAEEKLIVKLLPILDSFELALKNSTDKEKFIKGIEMIYAQFYQLLSNEGLKPIKAVGEKFDPHKHEVLMKIPSDKEEDIIIEELQKGYTFNDKIIRHSKVKTSQGKNYDNKKDISKESTKTRQDMPEKK